MKTSNFLFRELLLNREGATSMSGIKPSAPVFHKQTQGNKEQQGHFRQVLANRLRDHHAEKILLFLKIVGNCDFIWHSKETANRTKAQSKPRYWGQYLFKQFTIVANEQSSLKRKFAAREASQRIATFRLTQDTRLPEKPNFIPLFRFAMYGVEPFSLEIHTAEKRMGDQYNSYATKERNLLLDKMLVEAGLLDPKESLYILELEKEGTKARTSYPI